MTTQIDLWAVDASTRGLDPKTISSYVWSMKNFEAFLGRPISDAGKMDIRAYVDIHRKRGLTTRTIRSRLNALFSFYEFMIFEGMRQDNPVREVRVRYLSQYKGDSEQHTHKLISIDDASLLVSSCLDIRDKAMLLLMFKTGVRRGELLSMEVGDINWQSNSILLKPKKKRSNRIVFFDDEAAYVLRRWLEIRESRAPASSALWISSWGEPIGRGAIQHTIRLIAERCGLHDSSSQNMEDHFSAHCTRHWFTTHLRKAGMPREFIQELRGDIRREAIDAYDHIDKEELRRSYLAHVPQLGI
ncbi:MAG: tyrosine-type recombinase/integrase [Methanothrix sp.]